jgi:hypothetical protein
MLNRNNTNYQAQKMNLGKTTKVVGRKEVGKSSFSVLKNDSESFFDEDDNNNLKGDKVEKKETHIYNPKNSNVYHFEPKLKSADEVDNTNDVNTGSLNVNDINGKTEGEDWQTSSFGNGKKKGPKKNRYPSKKGEFERVEKILADVEENPNADKGKGYLFKNTWNVWAHEQDPENNSWFPESYDKFIFKIDSISSFWEFFNSFHDFDHCKYIYYIAKSGIHPTFEDDANRKGGRCSFKIEVTQSMDLMLQLCILLFNESMTDDPSDVNLIEFLVKPESNWAYIKLWNKTFNKEFENFLPTSIFDSYPNLSIKYDKIKPEYV